jgi:hypothetical protein
VRCIFHCKIRKKVDFNEFQPQNRASDCVHFLKMAAAKDDLPRPGTIDEAPKETKTLFQEFKGWMQQKRESAGPEPEEDYKKLSIAAVCTGTIIAIARQRMLGP